MPYERVSPFETIEPGTPESERATMAGRAIGIASDANDDEGIDGTEYHVERPQGDIDGLYVRHGTRKVAYVINDDVRACEDGPEHLGILRQLSVEFDVVEVQCPHCEGKGGGLERRRSGRIGIRHERCTCERCDGRGTLIG